MSDSDSGEDFNLNGWNASVAINGTKWLGFLADFGGYYGNQGSPEENADVKLYSIMFGPKASIRIGAVTPFVQALFGYARVTADMEMDDVTEQVFRENDFAMSFGGGVDINLNDRIAIRPAQLEYFTIKAGSTGDFADHFRFSTGVVFKLGKF
jgi:opacity protein-like surface antigen